MSAGLRDEAKFLQLRLGNVGKAHDNANSSAKEKGLQSGMPEYRTSLLKDELDVLKQKETKGCNMGTVHRKVVHARGEVNNLVDGLLRSIFESYTGIRHNGNQSLLVVSIRLNNLIDLKAQEFQRYIHAALCNAVGGVRDSFVAAPEVADRNLNLIVGHGRPDELAKLGSSTTYSASRESRRSLAKATSSSKGAAYRATP